MAEDKKAMNIKKLPSLNVNTGKQSSPTNVKKRTMLGEEHWFLKAIRNSKDNGLPTGTQTSPNSNDTLYKIKKVLGPSLGMKKGGKVKKAKCRDGIAQRGKTRGRMR